MKILKALISFDGENGIYKSDAIEHEGKYWLVPYWLGNIPGSKQVPVRIILLDSLPHQIHLGSAFGDISVSSPIPRAVHEGRSQPTKESGIVVIENPDISAHSQESH